MGMPLIILMRCTHWKISTLFSGASITSFRFYQARKKNDSFLSASDFESMKKSAVFINIGRGDVVQEEVLMTALNHQEISHAYLDVFEVEPLPKSHPFWKMSNVNSTPHISSTTMNYLPRALEIFRKNLHTYMNNDHDFINVIDPERGY